LRFWQSIADIGSQAKYLRLGTSQTMARMVLSSFMKVALIGAVMVAASNDGSSSVPKSDSSESKQRTISGRPLPDADQAAVQRWFLQYRGDEFNTGAYPDLVVPTSAPLKPEVFRGVGFNKGIHTAAKSSGIPLPSGSFLFPSDSNQLYRMDYSGNVIWVAAGVEFASNGFHSTPCVVAGKAILGSYSGHVYAFNVTTGHLIWQSKRMGMYAPASPSCTREHVYQCVEFDKPSPGGGVCKIRVDNGEAEWCTYNMRSHSHSTPAVDVARGLVVAGSNDYGLHVYDEWTGEVLSSRLCGLDEKPSETSVNLATNAVRGPENDLCLFNGENHARYFKHLHNWHLSFTKHTWKNNTRNKKHYPLLNDFGGDVKTPILMRKGIAVLGSWGNYMSAVDLNAFVTYTARGQIPVGEKIAAGEHGAVTSTEPFIRWRVECERKVMAGAAFDEETGRVYFGSHDSHIYAADFETGKVKWRFKTADYVLSSPIVCKNAVVCGSSDGKVYAVDKWTGEELWGFHDGRTGRVTSTPMLAHVVSADFEYNSSTVDTGTTPRMIFSSDAYDFTTSKECRGTPGSIHIVGWPQNWSSSRPSSGAGKLEL